MNKKRKTKKNAQHIVNEPGSKMVKQLAKRLVRAEEKEARKARR